MKNKERAIKSFELLLNKVDLETNHFKAWKTFAEQVFSDYIGINSPMYKQINELRIDNVSGTVIDDNSFLLMKQLIRNAMEYVEINGTQTGWLAWLSKMPLYKIIAGASILLATIIGISFWAGHGWRGECPKDLPFPSNTTIHTTNPIK